METSLDKLRSTSFRIFPEDAYEHCAKLIREEIDKEILETIIAAAQRLDSEPVPTKGRTIKEIKADDIS